MSENRDLARSLLAAARRRSNRFKREQDKSGSRRSGSVNDGGASDWTTIDLAVNARQA